MPCGPLRDEVCPSCWLAIGADDEIAKSADDLQEAMEFVEMREAAHLQYMDIVDLISDWDLANMLPAKEKR